MGCTDQNAKQGNRTVPESTLVAVTNTSKLTLTLASEVRVRAPCKRKAKIIITERQDSVLHSDWSRAKLVIFILEMDQSENRTRHRTRKSSKK